MRSDYYVYQHVRKDNGEIFYIGKGCNDRAFSKANRSNWWKRIVEKSGGYEVTFIAKDVDEEFAFLVEIERIDQLRKIGANICNISSGGDGVTCERWQEWKDKIGAAHKGKVISKETREKISISVKKSGYRHPKDVIERIRCSNLGKKRSLGYRHTEEWKAQNSERAKGNKSRTGQKRSEEERKKSSEKLSGRIQAKLECPKCGKIGGNAMRRWHFDNCKIGEPK